MSDHEMEDSGDEAQAIRAGASAIRKRRMTVDTKSWELAEHFLSDRSSTKEQVTELAERIQSAVEDYLSSTA